MGLIKIDEEKIVYKEVAALEVKKQVRGSLYITIAALFLFLGVCVMTAVNLVIGALLCGVACIAFLYYAFIKIKFINYLDKAYKLKNDRKTDKRK